jgi:hypothetical protein
MFSLYELQVLREAVISDLQMWEERVEQGDDISERFLNTLRNLETKIEHMIAEQRVEVVE